MKLRCWICHAGCLAALAVLMSSCGKDKGGARLVRHVIVVSLDTTRPDHFGCYGNPWIETPFIDAIASESIVFTNLMTVSPQTLPSHTSLFSGTYPHSNGVARNNFFVNEDNLLLAEILKANGFHTAAFVAAFPLARRFGLSQGFDHYDQEFQSNMWTAADEPNERPANAVTDAVIEYLDNDGVPERLFLFAHYYDPHKRYRSHKPYYTSYQGNRTVHRWVEATQGRDVSRKPDLEKNLNTYASEISFMDEHVGRLIEYLRTREILDDAIVVITSDHGENLVDHLTNFSHGKEVYQSTVHGMGIVRLPQGEKGGTKVEQLVSNVDVLPTLLQYLGLPVPAGIEGDPVDLTSNVIAFPPRTRFAEANRSTEDAETDPRWVNMNLARCVRDGDYKFIQTPHLSTEELYDLSLDPYEQNNLLADPQSRFAGIAEPLRRVLERWAESANPLPQPEPRSDEKTEETIRRLEALGYVE